MIIGTCFSSYITNFNIQLFPESFYLQKKSNSFERFAPSMLSSIIQSLHALKHSRICKKGKRIKISSLSFHYQLHHS